MGSESYVVIGVGQFGFIRPQACQADLQFCFVRPEGIFKLLLGKVSVSQEFVCKSTLVRAFFW